MVELNVSERAELYPGWVMGAPNGAEWYAIHLRSNFEKRVASELQGKGIDNYLPAYQAIHQWKDRKKQVEIPLFPGYVFARFRDEPDIRLRVLKTAGVVRILGLGSSIEPVPEPQINAVRRILDSGTKCSVHPLLETGTPIRVVRGPLAGLEGVLTRIKSQSRFVVSIPLLSQSVAAEVDSSDLEATCRR